MRPVRPCMLDPCARLALVFAFSALMLRMVSAGPLFVSLPNKYSAAEDVQLGRNAATVMREQSPLLADAEITQYVGEVGNRLVAELPADLRQPLFHYSFEVVNIADIGGVALPGGPIFVTRGLIETTRTEGQLAGVLAHQIGHIAMRHATMQASAKERFQIGEITGGEIGAAAAGNVAGVISQASRFAVTSYFLTYGDEAERQADALSVRLLAGAGYDPRSALAIFGAIANDESGRGSEWTFSHPSFGLEANSPSRETVIQQELRNLHVERAQAEDQLSAVRTRLAQLPIAHKPRHGAHAGGALGATSLGLGVVVPSGETRSATAGDLLQLTVPANWERVPAGNSVAFAPRGAFLSLRNGPTAFTHGLLIGVARTSGAI